MTAIGTNGSHTFQVDVGVAVSKYQLVTMTAVTGSVTEAGATDDVIGIAENDIAAAAADRTRGDVITVLPLNHSGTVRFLASAAIAVGDPLEKAASGQVATLAGGEALNFVCISNDIDNAGDVLEAIPMR